MLELTPYLRGPKRYLGAQPGVNPKQKKGKTATTRVCWFSLCNHENKGIKIQTFSITCPLNPTSKNIVRNIYESARSKKQYLCAVY